MEQEHRTGSPTNHAILICSPTSDLGATFGSQDLCSSAIGICRYSCALEAITLLEFGTWVKIKWQVANTNTV